MNTDDRNESNAIEGKEELQRLDMTINLLSRELHSAHIQEAKDTEWLSLLPWPITSRPMEEDLLCYGAGIAGAIKSTAS